MYSAAVQHPSVDVRLRGAWPCERGFPRRGMSLPCTLQYPAEDKRERHLFHLQPNERGSKTHCLSLGVETLISVVIKMFLCHYGGHWTRVHWALEAGPIQPEELNFSSYFIFIILHLNLDSRIWQWDTLLDNTVPVYSLWIFLIVTVANTYW